MFDRHLSDCQRNETIGTAQGARRQSTHTILARGEKGMTTIVYDRSRLDRTKTAFTTRRVPHDDMRTIVTDIADIRAGDLVLASVKSIGHHKGLQLRGGRRADLYAGEEIVLCFGNRYAPDQFEATLDGIGGTCHLAAAGGIASQVQCRHARTRKPTELTLIGLVGDAAGKPLNIGRYALPTARPASDVPLIVVLGTSMNAGKTTTMANLVRGLTAGGVRVGAAKVTGTGAFADVMAYTDAGAHGVLDFTDAGHVSTYRLELDELERVMGTLTGHLRQAGAEAIVVEVADGIFQRETAMLMQSRLFRDVADAVIFAAADAVSAVGGVNHLRQLSLPVLAVSGVITQSPLGCREAAEAAQVEVIPTFDLARPDVARVFAFPTPFLKTA